MRDDNAISDTLHDSEPEWEQLVFRDGPLDKQTVQVFKGKTCVNIKVGNAIAIYERPTGSGPVLTFRGFRQ